MPANNETPVFIIDYPLVIYSCVRVIGVEPIRFPYGPWPTRLPRVEGVAREVPILLRLCSELCQECDYLWCQTIGCDHLLWLRSWRGRLLRSGVANEGVCLC